MAERTGLEVAVVAMAGRFPGAPDLPAFWRRLAAGEECLRRFSSEELTAAGLSPEMRSHPGYVPVGGMLDEPDFFDAPFFGLSARDAEILDPQHRQLLECAWEALERAGYDAAQLKGAPVGVFAGCGINTYFLTHLLAQREFVASIGGFQTAFGIDKDHLAPLIAYKLGLEGPSITVQTACSTSLVAVHLACQALLNGECDLALAGGAMVQLPPSLGYVAQGDGFSSPGGHCRPYDADADGSVPGNGVGCVVLARLEDALAKGDPVLAVIKGSAVNNDGPQRAGYTAPRSDGQAKVIRAAQLLAEVDPATVTYVEGHGSATALGDPIEVAALTKAFRAGTDATGFCALGSVKSNIGHAGAAAGIAGLIKTVLALQHRVIPPTVHFTRPNPGIDFAASPFFVNPAAVDWPAENGSPRRAGVSSFGLGGTNAHVVLEEAPPEAASGPSRRWHLVTLSAATPTALEAATARLAGHLEEQPGEELADLAYTLGVGRRSLPYRRTLVCRQRAEALAALEDGGGRLLASREEERRRPVAFLLPGLGDHYPGMAAGLYRDEARFREVVDECAELLAPEVGYDLRELFRDEAAAASSGPDLRRMLGRGTGGAAGEAGGGHPLDSHPLDRPTLAQPALFTVEVALARLWESWGIRPEALLGYSLGEYTAACLAGVLTLPDALRLVARRAALVEELPPGAMTAVTLPQAEVTALLGEELSLAAVHGPEVSVVAGPVAAVSALEESLDGRGVIHRRLPVSRAFHSRMTAPAAEALTALARDCELSPPRVPYLSNVTGRWITAEEATDPAYWARHLTGTVRFAQGLAQLLSEPERCLLEVGPGQSLSSVVLQSPDAGQPVVASMRHAYEGEEDQAFLLTALAKLWLAGVRVDWEGFYAGQHRRRRPLPTYPFERRRYCLEPPAPGTAAATAARAGSAPAGEAPSTEPPPAAAAARHQRPALRTPYLAPRGGLEERLAGLWQELLGVAPVGVRDSFFDLGGHSLLGTRLIARLRSDFGAELTLRELFETPTVEALAARLEEQGGGATVALARRPAGEAVPLTFSQQRLWFLDRLAPANPFYNLAGALRLAGELSVPAFGRALREIVRRHETLRSRFREEGGQPVVEIVEGTSFPLPLVDLQGLAAGRGDELLSHLASALARRPFQLSREALLRVVLVRLEPGSDGVAEHGVLFAMHHIISDGWSMGVFVRELVALYSAFAAGEPSPLPPLPLQYSDYAYWQRRRLDGEALVAEVEHWRRALAGLPPLLELPTDRPRPQLQSFRGGRVEMVLPASLTAALEELGRRRGATLFMVLLAGFQLLLARYAGQRDLAVGTAVANRDRPELEGLIGFFVNTLALRADLAGRPSFEELLERVREGALTALAHQEVPFEKLVEELVRERSLRHPPLVQVMLVLQNTPPAAATLPGLRLTPVEVATETARFDLALSLAPLPGGEGARGLAGTPEYAGTLEYNGDLFDRTTVLRLVGHFTRLLEAAAAEPGRRAWALPWLAPAERHQLVVEDNDTAVAEAGEPLVHRLFAERAAAVPEAVAVIYSGERWSYGALAARVEALARELIRRGVEPEERVGVAAERTPELVVALMAILRAGGVYLPLDPALPPERLRWSCQDAGVRRLVDARRAGRGDGPTGGELPGEGIPVERVSVARAEGGGERPGKTTPWPPVLPRQAAYLFYTSGSTGRPKGVLVTHQGLVRHARWSLDVLRPGADDRVLANLSPSFDASLWELLPPLLGGAGLVLLPAGLELDRAATLRRMGEEAVTIWSAPPSILVTLREGLPLDACRRLRVLGCGGEALTAGLYRWLEELVGLQPINLYGPTEATVIATWEPAGSRGWNTPSVPIGRPVWETRALVLDEELAPVPRGVAGELYLGGSGLARAYLGRPGLTAAAFLPDLHADLQTEFQLGEAGGRLYRTGDRVRRLADGRLEFLGRIDQQVKLRGYRIELGEVEAVLARHPGVREAVAAVVSGEGTAGTGDGQRLVAYLVPAAGQAPDPAALRESLRESLPPYLVPAAFVTLEALPTTSTGKVDRRALPVPAGDRALAAAAYTAPRGPVEAKLAGVWSRLLGVEPVGVEDDFFELGGHSLLATQVVAQVRDAFGVELPVRVLFENPTVAGLAEALVERQAVTAEEDELAAMLERLEEMGDEEVAALLVGAEEGDDGGEERPDG